MPAPVIWARWLRAMLGFIGMMLVAHVWVLLPLRWRWRRHLSRTTFRVLLWGFRIRVRVVGEALAGPGLMVANHTSWTDIAVLGAVTDASFVAKAQVNRWPIIGRLTRRHGGLFIDRERRGDVGGMGPQMIERWRLGARSRQPANSFILFPEGTTSAGGGVLPFRSSLFEAAASEGVAVQPVAIRYLEDDGGAGRALSPATLRRVAWVGDDLLAPHAASLASGIPLIAEVWFGPVALPSDRKTLATDTRAAICARMGYPQ